MASNVISIWSDKNSYTFPCILFFFQHSLKYSLRFPRFFFAVVVKKLNHCIWSYFGMYKITFELKESWLTMEKINTDYKRQEI